VCLWSHMGGRPVHIHFLVQPTTRALIDEMGVYGPHLTVALFDAERYPSRDEIGAFADRARSLLQG
jgi:hypothetical protein